MYVALARSCFVRTTRVLHRFLRPTRPRSFGTESSRVTRGSLRNRSRQLAEAPGTRADTTGRFWERLRWRYPDSTTFETRLRQLALESHSGRHSMPCVLASRVSAESNGGFSAWVKSQTSRSSTTMHTILQR